MLDQVLDLWDQAPGVPCRLGIDRELPAHLYELAAGLPVNGPVQQAQRLTFTAQIDIKVTRGVSVI